MRKAIIVKPMTLEIYRWLLQYQTHEELIGGEVLADPQFWRRMAEAGIYQDALTDHLTAPSRGTDFQVLAEKFIFRKLGPNFDAAVRTALKKVGTAVYQPTLQRIAEDRVLAQSLVERTESMTVFREGDPFARFCALLDGTDDPPLALGFTDHENPEVRKLAVLATCATGGRAMIPVFQSVVRAGDEPLCARALIGLKRAVEAERLHPSAADQLYPDVLRLVEEGKCCWDSMWLLVKLNFPQAMRDLKSDWVLHPDNPNLADALRYFVRKEDLPDRGKLEILLKALTGKQRTPLQDSALGRLLRVIGRHRLPEDLPLLEEFTKHPDSDIANRAARGLLAWHGMDRAREIALRDRAAGAARDARDWYAAVWRLDGGNRNMGIIPYFESPDADAWQEALKGLEKSGSVERLSVFRQALSVFPDSVPQPSVEERTAYLNGLTEAQRQFIQQLEDQFGKTPERVEVLLARLALRQPELFRE